MRSRLCFLYPGISGVPVKHMKLMFSDDSRGRQEIFMFGCSIMRVILSIREWRCQDIDQVLLHEIVFFCFSVFSSSEVLGKITSIQSKLPTAACGLGKKREETVKPACFSLFYVESDKSFQQYSLPVEALNSIVDSKSQPLEAKEKLAIILFCGFWFPCFNAIWYDLRCHVAWRLKFCH